MRDGSLKKMHGGVERQKKGRKVYGARKIWLN